MKHTIIGFHLNHLDKLKNKISSASSSPSHAHNIVHPLPIIYLLNKKRNNQ